MTTGTMQVGIPVIVGRRNDLMNLEMVQDLN
jgi:hypothetical protein